MGLGPRLVKCGKFAGAACSLKAEEVTACHHLNTTFLSATIRARKALHGHLARQTGKANCTPSYNNWPKLPGWEPLFASTNPSAWISANMGQP